MKETFEIFTGRSVEEKHQHYELIIEKYPDYVPIIVDFSHIKKEYPNARFDKFKYLYPKHFTVGQIQHATCKRIKLPPEHAIFMFFNKKIIPVSTLVTDIIAEANEDGFIYAEIHPMATFG